MGGRYRWRRGGDGGAGRGDEPEWRAVRRQILAAVADYERAVVRECGLALTPATMEVGRYVAVSGPDSVTNLLPIQGVAHDAGPGCWCGPSADTLDCGGMVVWHRWVQ